MEFLDRLPEPWRWDFSDAEVKPVSSGSGGALVFRIVRASGAKQFLKIAVAEHVQHLRNEIERTTWLASYHINVPAILQTAMDAGSAAVLMSALEGQPIEACRRSPGELIKAIVTGLAHLHTLPVEACPFDESLSVRLARAEADVSCGRIDQREFRDRNLGLAPRQLLDRLLETAPGPEDLVVVHGDATFTNILIDSAGLIGFVDCGHCGRADRYVDLAVITSEIEDQFGQEWLGDFFRAYGFGFHPWRSSKMRFFSDLYDLF